MRRAPRITEPVQWSGRLQNNHGMRQRLETEMGTGPGAIAAAGYWAPVTNGDPVTPELLFDSNGECLVGFVPTP